MNANRTVTLIQVSKEKTGETPDAREVTAALYQEFRRQHLQALRPRCGATDAEDITQETFLRFYDTLARGQSIPGESRRRSVARLRSSREVVDEGRIHLPRVCRAAAGAR
jgi:Sigma-70 region 2